jgi:hypothetical protein
MSGLLYIFVSILTEFVSIYTTISNSNISFKYRKILTQEKSTTLVFTLKKHRGYIVENISYYY